MFGWDDALSFGLKIVDKLIPDPAAKAEAARQLQQMAQAGEFKQIDAALQMAQMQADVNKLEAASSDKFTSRGRPFIIWVCGIALAYTGIIDPMARFVARVCFAYAGDFPVIDNVLMGQILFGLLGLSGMRSYDKKNGVAS